MSTPEVQAESPVWPAWEWPRYESQLGRPFGRERALAAFDEQFDCVGQVHIGNVMITPRLTQLVGFVQHLSVGGPGRWVEFVARALDQLTQRIAEVNRVHETPIHFARVADPTFVESLGNLGIGCPRHRESKVVKIANPFRVAGCVHGAPLVRKNCHQPAVAWIEVEMALFGHIQVWLLENEWHAQHALPEIDTRLSIGAIMVI